MLYLEYADGPWLTLLVLSPLLGVLLIALGRALRLSDQLIKVGATAWSLVPLGWAIFVWVGFEPNLVQGGQSVVQFVERVPWISAVRVDYFLGVDGLSMPLVLLTTLLAPIAALAAFPLRQRVATHYALLLLTETAMLGYFVALNFFFFFLFWEISLVPIFFLIQHWGRDPQQRRMAALKFFVYTMAGSLGLLLVFQFLYVATGAARDPALTSSDLPSFDLITLARLGQGLPVLGRRPELANLQSIIFDYVDYNGISDVLGRFPLLYSSIAFWGIFLAFAVKLGIWPFHTWLPDAYAEAPSSAAILLAGAMSKMGAYGMLRLLLPLVPEAAQSFGPLICALSLIGVIAGAFGALAQVGGDMRRLVAYTSVNHMGYVGMAIGAAASAGPADASTRAIAINGALMLMVAHGLSTGALFLLLGMLRERTGTDQLAELGGLRRVMPLFAAAMGLALFANLGLPGLAGFVGEFFILRGVWPVLPFFTLLATLGLIITALALLRMYGRLFNGPLDERWQALPDLRLRSREFLAAAPLLAGLLILGLYPAPILDLSNQAATQLVQLFVQLGG